jgi:YesN/AraC family two-component response regulator
MYKRGKEAFLSACLDACKAFEEERTAGKLVVQWLQTLEELLGKDKHDHHPVRNIQQVYEILNRLMEEEKDDSKAAIPEHVSEAVRVAAEFAWKHYHEHIGLSEAAEAAGVNASYLSYLFSQEMGVGFSAFLLNQRISQARKLLVKTSLSVKEIASKSGFNDYQYFSKIFKKQVGLSPVRYRQTSSKN